MVFKCKNCGSKSNDMEFGIFCDTCQDTSRIKEMPGKREYNSELIFNKYLENECPVCDGEVKCDSQYSHTENGGKCMAKYFECSNCGSRYTVGYNRNRQPINSEITFNAVY
jgi:C4-type Zn-finger protein